MQAVGPKIGEGIAKRKTACNLSRHVSITATVESPGPCPVCGHRARVDIRLRSDERGDVALARVYCGRLYCTGSDPAEAMQPFKVLGKDAAVAADVARDRAVALWNLTARRIVPFVQRKREA